MPEEDIQNQNGNSSAVEDVFSEVDQPENKTVEPDSLASKNNSLEEGSTPEGIDISENSIGQKKVSSPEKVEEKNIPESGSKNVNTGKILFYLILFLIILLGAFAIWALVF